MGEHTFNRKCDNGVG